MRNSKLILFEGIPGSGKTTMAKLLFQYLRDHNVDADVFLEGCNHPVDLTWHAYLTLDEYQTFLQDYPDYNDRLTQCSIFESNYVLVPYKHPTIQQDDITHYLSSREVCYSDQPVIPLKKFTKVFRTRFRRFTEKAANENKITIFDSTFFQHQIHDLVRLYHPEIDLIIEHLQSLESEISVLNPLLVYISQNNVKESLQRIASIRDNPKWATDQAIKFWENRKTIEIQAMEKLTMKTVVIDNTNFDSIQLFQNIIEALKQDASIHM